jgi:DNA-binding NarL/FixJ family response regulator
VQPRILIVDDHEIVRQGVSTLILRTRPDWSICGEAGDGYEAIDAAVVLNPDVIVLDITMPHLSGLAAAHQILERKPGCRIIMFTMHDSESLESEVRSTGAHGFVLKSQAAHDLILAIETLMAGGTFFGVPVLPKTSRNSEPKRGMALRIALATGKP